VKISEKSTNVTIGCDIWPDMGIDINNSKGKIKAPSGDE